MNDVLYLKRWLRSGLSSESTESERRELLNELEQFFTYIFNSSKDGISVLDESLTIVMVNSAMERWYHDKLPLVGKKCYAIYHNRRQPCRNCPSLTALRKGRPEVGVVPYEPSGRTRGTQELSVFPLYDDKRTIFGLLEYVRDITHSQKEERIVENLKRRMQFQEQTLREQEVALEVLLRRRASVEDRMADVISKNVITLIEPLIQRLRKRYVDPESKRDFDLLSSRLQTITSPFMQNLSPAERGLTPREREIARFVSEGWETKEIAEALFISPKTVDYHRANLRKKLGLTNSRERLQTYLARLQEHQVFPSI